MVDIIHRIGIKASPTEVYAALSTVDGVAGWWTRETTGVSKVGGVMTVVREAVTVVTELRESPTVRVPGSATFGKQHGIPCAAPSHTAAR